MSVPVQPIGLVIPQAPTTQDERTMALLAQILQLVGGWIPALIIFCVRRQSRFVSFHALQVLLLQGVFLVAIILSVMGFFAAIVLGVLSTAWLSQEGSSVPSPIFLLLPFFGLSWVGITLFKLVTAIVFCVRASRGEWAEYPVLGRWARQILKIGPGGAVLL
jgi:uncharacterized membrane protein